MLFGRVEKSPFCFHLAVQKRKRHTSAFHDSANYVAPPAPDWATITRYVFALLRAAAVCSARHT